MMVTGNKLVWWWLVAVIRGELGNTPSVNMQHNGGDGHVVQLMRREPGSGFGKLFRKGHVPDLPHSPSHVPDVPHPVSGTVGGSNGGGSSRLDQAGQAMQIVDQVSYNPAVQTGLHMAATANSQPGAGQYSGGYGAGMGQYGGYGGSMGQYGGYGGGMSQYGGYGGYGGGMSYGGYNGGYGTGYNGYVDSTGAYGGNMVYSPGQGTGVGYGAGVGQGQIQGTDTGSNTGTGGNTGAGTNTGTGTNTGSNTGTGTNTGSSTGTSTNTGQAQVQNTGVGVVQTGQSGVIDPNSGTMIGQSSPEVKADESKKVEPQSDVSEVPPIDDKKDAILYLDLAEIQDYIKSTDPKTPSNQNQQVKSDTTGKLPSDSGVQTGSDQSTISHSGVDQTATSQSSLGQPTTSQLGTGQPMIGQFGQGQTMIGQFGQSQPMIGQSQTGYGQFGYNQLGSGQFGYNQFGYGYPNVYSNYYLQSLPGKYFSSVMSPRPEGLSNPNLVYQPNPTPHFDLNTGRTIPISELDDEVINFKVPVIESKLETNNDNKLNTPNDETRSRKLICPALPGRSTNLVDAARSALNLKTQVSQPRWSILRYLQKAHSILPMSWIHHPKIYQFQPGNLLLLKKPQNPTKISHLALVEKVGQFELCISYVNPTTSLPDQTTIFPDEVETLIT